MGLFAKDKGLAEQLQESLARSEALTAELATVKSENETLRADSIKAGELKDGLDKAQLEIARLGESIKTESARADALTAENTKLKEQLANPAQVYQQANEGRKNPVADGGEGSSVTPTREKLWETYSNMTDPKEKAVFFKLNRESMEKK